MRIITGRARGLKLTTPKNWDVRPTADRVKESVFNIIGSKIIGAQVLDLFAGTGNLGLESWSRGAEKIVFTDTSKESLRLVESNIAKCRAQDDTETIWGDACQLIGRLHKKGMRFDFVFADPPYNKGLVQKVIAALAESPLLNDGGYLIAEHSAHDELGTLPPQFELVRCETYGETKISFIRFAKV